MTSLAVHHETSVHILHNCQKNDGTFNMSAEGGANKAQKESVQVKYRKIQLKDLQFDQGDNVSVQ